MRDFNAAKDTAEAGLLSYKYTSSVNLFFTGAYFDTATFMTRWVWFLLKEKLIILSNGCLWRQAADDRRIQARERYPLHPPLCTSMHTLHQYAHYAHHYAHQYAVHVWVTVQSTHPQISVRRPLCTKSALCTMQTIIIHCPPHCAVTYTMHSKQH